MLRDGYEVNARADLAAPEFIEKLVAADAQPPGLETENVEVPGVPAVTAVARRLHLLHVAQQVGIKPCEGGAALDEVIQLPQLVDAQRGLQVAQVVLESGLEHFVVPVAVFAVAVPGVLADAVEREDAHPARQAPCGWW